MKRIDPLVYGAPFSAPDLSGSLLFPSKPTQAALQKEPKALATCPPSMPAILIHMAFLSEGTRSEGRVLRASDRQEVGIISVKNDMGPFPGTCRA